MAELIEVHPQVIDVRCLEVVVTGLATAEEDGTRRLRRAL